MSPLDGHSIRPYLVIVTTHEETKVNPALAGWLRNERLLGARHIAIPPPEPIRAAAATEPTSAAARPRPPAPAALPLATVNLDETGLPPLCGRELSPGQAQAALDALSADFVQGCTKCVLHEKRTKAVFGQGNPRPALVFVGEGPGADEDMQGLAFVGRAGQLLTRMITAMTLGREDVYISNIVKCRPPNNRTPTENESTTCLPYLLRQLAILRPKVIVALGRPASQTLLATTMSIGRLRGQFHDFPPPALRRPELPSIKLMPTYHPAYLLRSPGEKGKTWADLMQVMSQLGIPLPAGN